MNEFIEKLIGRLQGREQYYHECALDEIMQNGHTLDAEGFLGKEDAYGDAISITKQLAEEHKGGWIPCSERLPEECGRYIVTMREWTDGNYYPKYDDMRVKILNYACGWIYPLIFEKEGQKDKHFEVIAWQPLPKPYNPKGE